MRGLNIKNGDRLACMVIVFGVIQFFLLTFLAALVYPGARAQNLQVENFKSHRGILNSPKERKMSNR